ncbi:MAG TPA: HIT domain-containing protein [Candidatus Nitrosotalea sp.]|nr:HIT domain-containing protein [Candidatus Nitrosotalea sp.]
MNFGELQDFILHKMKMQHIYQPVMIKTLLKENDRASVRTVARSFLEKDESQLEYYEHITKVMPGKVLKRHGIVSYDAGVFSLNVFGITDSERSELISLCNQKIMEYAEKRGKLIWQHRARDSRLVPGSLRFHVLKRARYRCELCGISAEEKALDVDHILPRNKGGRTVIENLQALCYTCNSQKRDLDDTDFRPWKDIYESRQKDCVFCKLERSSKINNSLAFVLEDKYPVSDGHLLICPRRHVRSFFEFGGAEYNSCILLLQEMKAHISKKDSSVTGFNVGINDGQDAGQTIFHSHIHLIPRRKGDVNDPTGGIRNIIHEMGRYG